VVEIVRHEHVHVPHVYIHKNYPKHTGCARVCVRACTQDLKICTCMFVFAFDFVSLAVSVAVSVWVFVLVSVSVPVSVSISVYVVVAVVVVIIAAAIFVVMVVVAVCSWQDDAKVRAVRVDDEAWQECAAFLKYQSLASNQSIVPKRTNELNEDVFVTQLVARAQLVNSEFQATIEQILRSHKVATTETPRKGHSFRCGFSDGIDGTIELTQRRVSRASEYETSCSSMCPRIIRIRLSCVILAGR